MCGTDTAGRGALEPPPEAALEQSYIRPRIPVPRIPYCRDKKLLTKYLTPKKDFIYMYLYFQRFLYEYLFSFFTPRFEPTYTRLRSGQSIH